jgi:hypothetical protein
MIGTQTVTGIQVTINKIDAPKHLIEKSQSLKLKRMRKRNHILYTETIF